MLEKHCARCHTSGGKKAKRATLAHFSMDSYPFGGHHATEIGEEIREVLGVAGKKASMPEDRPGVVQGEELALVVAWTEAFDRSHAAGLHDHGPGHGAGHGAGHDHGKPAGKKPDKARSPKKPAAHEHQHGPKTPAENKPAGNKPADKPQHDHGKGHDHGHHNH